MDTTKVTSRKTREDLTDQIAEVFRRYGYDGASLGLISEATGLGRASLYHHFPGGKYEMCCEVFARIGEHVDREMLAPLRAQGSTQQRLTNWIQGIYRFYDGGRKNCLIGSMVLGGGSDIFSEQIAGMLRTLIGVLAGVLRGDGFSAAVSRARAEAAVGQIQGALVVCRGLGDNKHFHRVLKGLSAQLQAKE